MKFILFYNGNGLTYANDNFFCHLYLWSKSSLKFLHIWLLHVISSLTKFILIGSGIVKDISNKDKYGQLKSVFPLLYS